jgi:hypothetical protein
MNDKSPRVAIAALLAVLIGGGCASSSTPPLEHPIVHRASRSAVKYCDVQPEDLIPPAASDYRVQPGDALEVGVRDLVAPGVETVRRFRVGGSGTISLPLIGSVYVAGMTEEQINDVVNKWFRDNLCL